jgi:hypothetical protein
MLQSSSRHEPIPRAELLRRKDDALVGVLRHLDGYSPFLSARFGTIRPHSAAQLTL